MLKKISVLVLILFAVALFAADDTYQIVMLGDLHYDNVDCREPEMMKNLKDYQKYELDRNLRSWREDGESLKMLEAAGKMAEQLNAPFVIQNGDFVQGDAGSEEMATKMILSCMDTCKKYIHVPFIATKGNHDPRGKGANAAVNKTLPAFWSKELNINPPLTRTTFAHRQGPDVFIFLDDISLGSQKKEKVNDKEIVTFPNLEYFESLLKANADARYTFIVCHLPIIPTSAERWIPFGGQKTDAQRKYLLNLLCEHNAIILCGHIHANSFIEFENEKGKVAQITCISLFPSPNAAKMGRPNEGCVEKYMVRKSVKDEMAKNPAAWTDFLGPYMSGLKRYITLGGAGYCIVRISPDGVVNEYRSILDPEYCTSIKMR
ncbi:MAG: metallophosphoesterase [Victivallales bacterium]|nr:metallophosphoesterase [Victivallales bacterium]